jgi:hypothetical protein
VALLLIPATVLAAVVAGLLVARRLTRRGARLPFLWGCLAGAGAFTGCWALLFGAALAALFEPWPLSLRQGPDTEYARACFERQLRRPPPPGFVDLYCRQEWGFGGDSVHSIRFTYPEDLAAAAVARHLGMDRVGEPDRSTLRYLRGPPWWPSRAELSGLPRVYRRGPYAVLWMDPVSRTGYYQKAAF